MKTQKELKIRNYIALVALFVFGVCTSSLTYAHQEEEDLNVPATWKGEWKKVELLGKTSNHEGITFQVNGCYDHYRITHYLSNLMPWVLITLWGQVDINTIMACRKAPILFTWEEMGLKDAWQRVVTNPMVSED